MKAFLWFFLGVCVIFALGFLLVTVVAFLIPLMVPVGLVVLIWMAFSLFRSPKKPESPDVPPTP